MSDTPTLLSVTATLGCYTVFKDTRLSLELGLKEGDLVPLVVHPGVLVFESAVEPVERLEPSEAVRLREGMKMTQAEFAKFVSLHPDTIAFLETDGAGGDGHVLRVVASTAEESKGRIYHGLFNQDFDPDDIPRHPRKQERR